MKTLTKFTNSRGTTFTLGEWIVAEYSIQLIKEIIQYDTHTVVERSTGYITCSGQPDDCWKLTLTSKVIAEGVQRYRDKLGELKGEVAFNWPDLHRKLVEFAEIGYELDRTFPLAEDYNERDKQHELYRKQLWEPLEVFYEQIEKASRTAREVEVGGVRLFR